MAPNNQEAWLPVCVTRMHSTPRPAKTSLVTSRPTHKGNTLVNIEGFLGPRPGRKTIPLADPNAHVKETGCM